MAINFSPKVGEILECNFGNYPVSQNGQFSTTYYDGRIPPEMIKNRLVVVLNGKINGNACIVVPLSTTRDHDKLNRGMHVEIASCRFNWSTQQLCENMGLRRFFE
ncbi:hypothetical protein NB16F79_28210 [Escherichia coli]